MYRNSSHPCQPLTFDLTVQEFPPANDIWWPSLETYSNLFTSVPPTSADICWQQLKHLRLLQVGSSSYWNVFSCLNHIHNNQSIVKGNWDGGFLVLLPVADPIYFRKKCCQITSCRTCLWEILDPPLLTSSCIVKIFIAFAAKKSNYVSGI